MADAFRRAVAQLSRLPGVGEKTATRYAWWLLRQPPEVAAALSEAIHTLRVEVRECEACRDFTDAPRCRRCEDPRRDASTLCVVERPQDIAVLDGAGNFHGRFHVLHGALSPLDGVGPEQLRLKELVARLDGVREVVVATDPDVEGDATGLYLARLLRPLGVKVTRLAHGIAVGTDIEFADRVSLARAFEGRREL